MLRPVPYLALIVFLSVLGEVALAQLSAPDRSTLVDQIRAAATNLDAESFPDFAASKAEFARRVDAVRRYLTAHASPENRDAWLAYLDLEPLVEAIASDESPAVIARKCVDLRYRLIGTAPGLELSAMRGLRDSVEQMIEAARFLDQEKSKESLALQLQAIADRVSRFDENPSADDFAAASVLMDLLKSSGQADELVHSLRNTFGHPNVAILISEPMVQTTVNQQVNRTRPVRDCILGTRIIGHATMNGYVTANLLPCVGAARVSVTLDGHVVSNNIGYNGPVRLRTIGSGDVHVSRTLMISESGIRLEPTCANATLSTRITSIEHNLGLVRKIASKKAAEQKPLADRIAVERLRNQVGAQFTTQTSQASAVVPADAFQKFLPLLARLSLAEPTRVWGSTEQEVFIESMLRRHDQLSSAVPRPPMMQSYDAAVQIHETAIDNAFTPVLAGRTVSEKRLNELLEKSGRKLAKPADDPEQASEPPFEIDFARLRPIIFEARDQTLRLGVRGTRFAQGGRELKQAMEITAVYEPATNADGVVVLLRKGDVDVDFPGRGRLSISQAGLKRTIQKKFSDVFPEVILERSLDVPADAKIESLRGRAFRPHLVEANDGWLTIAVR